MTCEGIDTRVRLRQFEDVLERTRLPSFIRIHNSGRGRAHPVSPSVELVPDHDEA